MIKPNTHDLALKAETDASGSGATPTPKGFDEGWGPWGLDPMGEVLDEDFLPKPLEVALRLFDPGPPMGFGESAPAPAAPPAPARPRTEPSRRPWWKRMLQFGSAPSPMDAPWPPDLPSRASSDEG